MTGDNFPENAQLEKNHNMSNLLICFINWDYAKQFEIIITIAIWTVRIHLMNIVSLLLSSILLLGPDIICSFAALVEAVSV